MIETPMTGGVKESSEIESSPESKAQGCRKQSKKKACLEIMNKKEGKGLGGMQREGRGGVSELVKMSVVPQVKDLGG